MKMPPFGRSPLVIERPAVPAADPANDTVLAARAALRRAGSIRNTAAGMLGAAEAEVEQLKALVKRLEAER